MPPKAGTSEVASLNSQPRHLAQGPAASLPDHRPTPASDTYAFHCGMGRVSGSVSSDGSVIVESWVSTSINVVPLPSKSSVEDSDWASRALLPRFSGVLAISATVPTTRPALASFACLFANLLIRTLAAAASCSMARSIRRIAWTSEEGEKPIFHSRPITSFFVRLYPEGKRRSKLRISEPFIACVSTNPTAAIDVSAGESKMRTRSFQKPNPFQRPHCVLLAAPSTKLFR
mmetsp:Transcript_6502/g.13248  ORF Transcript_6502/g.13248 Transcript_6502/m.13248 type:complete len:231 (-) Transcript_6502:1836-2528(-)